LRFISFSALSNTGSRLLGRPAEADGTVLNADVSELFLEERNEFAYNAGVLLAFSVALLS